MNSKIERARWVMANAPDLLGVPEGIAHSACASLGIQCRTLIRDGVWQVKTSDTKMDRINIGVIDGFVCSVSVG